MLTASELSAMRETTADFLPDTAVIQTVTATSDGGGGGSIVWTAAGTVDCRMAPLSGGEGLTAGRISADAAYVLTLPHGSTIDTNARVIYSGGTYNVEAIRDRSYETSLRVEVNRI